MTKYIKLAAIYFLFFIYIYQVVFKVIPISSKFFIYGMGLLYAVPKIVSSQYYLKKEYVGILRFAVVVFLWDMVVCFLNMNFEMYLTKNLVPIVLSFFGANFLYDFSKSYIRDNTDFLRVVLITVFIQSALSISMKYIPPLYSFFDAVQVFLFPVDDVGDDITLMIRFVGIGAANYFAALLSCSLALMSAIRLITSSDNVICSIIYLFMYIVIVIFTFFTARTAILLVALSIFFLFLYQRRMHFSRVLTIVCGLVVVTYVAFMIIGKFFDENTLKWAAAIFTDKSGDGSFGQVIDWWRNTEFSLKTLLIGDGRYSDGELLYYKRIDIGIFREIFYGGILGLVLNMAMHYKTLNYVWKNDQTRETRLLTLSLFFSYCIILCKGDANMMSMFILFLVFFTKGIFGEKKAVSVCMPRP